MTCPHHQSGRQQAAQDLPRRVSRLHQADGARAEAEAKKPARKPKRGGRKSKEDTDSLDLFGDKT